MGIKGKPLSLTHRLAISGTRKKLFRLGVLENWHKYHIGQNSPNWKGGRHITENGYIRCTIFVNGKTKLVYEHRLVMEKYLGRPLLKKESVHHLNGIKTDNRLENLLLTTVSHNSREGSPIKKALQKRIRELEEQVNSND